MLVPSLVIVTAAFAITAPDWSVTTPRICASKLPCPCAAGASSAAMTSNNDSENAPEKETMQPAIRPELGRQTRMASLQRALSYYYELKLLLSFMMKVKSNRSKVIRKTARQ